MTRRKLSARRRALSFLLKFPRGWDTLNVSNRKQYSNMSTINSTNSSLAKKAHRVGTIFETLAVLVVILGGLGVVVTVLGGLVNAAGDGGAGTFFMSLFVGAVIATYTAITWACISLATIVAEYIAGRS